MERGRSFLMGFESSRDHVTMINKIVEMREVELSWQSQALCDVSYSYTWKDKLILSTLSAMAVHFLYILE